jgi:hypothetical protein
MLIVTSRLGRHYMEHQWLRYSRTNRNELIRGGLHFVGGGLVNVHLIAGPISIGYGAPQNNRFSRVPRILGFTRSPHSWTPEKGRRGFVSTLPHMSAKARGR